MSYWDKLVPHEQYQVPPWWSKYAPSDVNPNGADWLNKFNPMKDAPTTPQTVPTNEPQPSNNPAPPEPPTPPAIHAQVEDVILAYNNKLSFFTNTSSYINSVKGVIVNKISAEQAAATSTRIKPAAATYELPLPFALACLAIESTLDPNCQNGNLGPGESNTGNDPLGYDMGIAQLKLRYLVNVAAGVTDVATARAFTLDVDKAIPYFCSLMATKVLWAQKTIENNRSSVPDPRLSNEYLLATGAYNFGATGMMGYYESGQFPSHCQHVLDLTAFFAKALGVENPLAGL